MSLPIVVGKKGSGKTAFALGQIERELVHGTRPVVTNMQIFPEKLEAYLRGKGHEVAVADRLVLLDPRDPRFARWWRIRGKDSKGEIRMAGAFPDGEGWADCDGVFFVVDEGQKFYGSRSWTERMKSVSSVTGEPSIGREAEDYLCQERKTGDDTIVTTPSSSLLDKQFRTLATECVVLDNWYKKKILGVTPPGRFQARIYENCPPQLGEEPVSSPHFHLDVAGLMSCYNTGAGAGFIGSQADKGKDKPKGIPLWGVLAMLPVCGILVWYGIHAGVRWAAGKALAGGGLLSTVHSGTVKTNVVVKTNDVVARVSAPSFASVSNVMMAANSVVRAKDERYFTGWGRSGDVAVVVEDSGAHIYGKELRDLGSTVVLDGQVFVRKKKRESYDGVTFPANFLGTEVRGSGGKKQNNGMKEKTK